MIINNLVTRTKVYMEYLSPYRAVKSIYIEQEILPINGPINYLGTPADVRSLLCKETNYRTIHVVKADFQKARLDYIFGELGAPHITLTIDNYKVVWIPKLYHRDPLTPTTDIIRELNSVQYEQAERTLQEVLDCRDRAL